MPKKPKKHNKIDKEDKKKAKNKQDKKQETRIVSLDPHTQKALESWQRLCKAAKVGDLNTMDLLLRNGTDINFGVPHDDTALWRAVEAENLKGVEFLLSRKACVDPQNDSGQMPLLVAALKGNPAIVAVLIQAKADVNKADTLGITALLAAANNGNNTIINLLLDAKADLECRHPSNLHTPLMIATCENHADTVSLLVFRKANMESRDTKGVTALMQATGLNSVSVAELLIGARANIHAESNTKTIAICFAIEHETQSLRFTKLLLDQKADIFHRSEYGTTPIECAVKQQNREVVELFLERLAVKDVPEGLAHDDDHTRAEGLAHERAESLDTAIELILCAALKYGAPKMLRYIKEKERFMKKLKELGELPLQSTIFCRSAKGLEFLLENGLVEANQICKNIGMPFDFPSSGIRFTFTGITPLMYAIYLDNLEAVKILTRAGANITSIIRSKTQEGESITVDFTPLTLARGLENQEAVQLLLSHLIITELKNYIIKNKDKTARILQIINSVCKIFNEMNPHYTVLNGLQFSVNTFLEKSIVRKKIDSGWQGFDMHPMAIASLVIFIFRTEELEKQSLSYNDIRNMVFREIRKIIKALIKGIEAEERLKKGFEQFLNGKASENRLKLLTESPHENIDIGQFLVRLSKFSAEISAMITESERFLNCKEKVKIMKAQEAASHQRKNLLRRAELEGLGLKTAQASSKFEALSKEYDQYTSKITSEIKLCHETGNHKAAFHIWHHFNTKDTTVNKIIDSANAAWGSLFAIQAEYLRIKELVIAQREKEEIIEEVASKTAKRDALLLEQKSELEREARLQKLHKEKALDQENERELLSVLEASEKRIKFDQRSQGEKITIRTSKKICQ